MPLVGHVGCTAQALRRIATVCVRPPAVTTTWVTPAAVPTAVTSTCWLLPAGRLETFTVTMAVLADVMVIELLALMVIACTPVAVHPAPASWKSRIEGETVSVDVGGGGGGGGGGE